MEQLKITTIVETDAAENSVDGLNKGIETTEDSTNSLSESLDSMTGGAISGFKKMVSGVQRGVMAMKTLKGAIIATGIGALVIAVGTLYTFFTRNQQGADKLNQIFKTVGATIDVLIDRIGTFGSGLWEILNGNFDKGLDILKGSFAGVGDEILRESKAALDLEKAFQALEKRKINFIVTEKKLQAEIEAASLASEQTTNGLKAQQDAIELAISKTRELSNERTAQTKEELRIVTERNALGETLNADLQIQRELEGQLFEITTQRDTRLKELVAKQRTLLGLKKEEKELDRPALEAMDAIESKSVSALSPEGEIKVSQEEFMLNKLKQQNDKFNADKAVADQIAADQKEILDQQRVQANIATIQTGLAVVQGLFEQGTQGAKFAAAAQATFDTYAAIAGQLASTARTPAGAIPGFAIAQAIATGAFGLLQVKRILSTNTKRPSTPSIGGSRSGGSSIPTQGQQDNRAPNFESLNFGVGGQQGAGFGTVRAVVINSQFKNQQKIDARVQDLLSNG
jgi:hypothetical protein